MAYYTSVTEDYWIGFHEDYRLAWKLFIRVFAIVLMYSVEKTGHFLFDIAITLAVASIIVVGIESQRNYAKYSKRIRQLSVRLLITLTSFLIALIGWSLYLLIFATIGYAVWSAMIEPLLIRSFDYIEQFFLVASYVVAISIAILKDVRERQVVHHLRNTPCKLMADLIVRQKFKATDFPSFAIYEVGVVYVGYLITSLSFLSVNSYIEYIGI